MTFTYRKKRGSERCKTFRSIDSGDERGDDFLSCWEGGLCGRSRRFEAERQSSFLFTRY